MQERGLTRMGFILVLLALPLLQASNCDDKSNPLEDDEFTAVVDLVNGDVLPVHLFTPGESFPCCQVSSNGARNRTMTLKPGQSYTFRAGRNGQIIATVSCVAPSSDSASLDVHFSPLFGFECVGW